MSVDSLNQLLGLSTLALQIITAALAVAYLLRNRVPMCGDVIRQVGSIALPASLAVSLGAAAMTLYYSDILGFEPCPLCWWQRIFLYPQIILMALAMWRKDAGVWISSITLSIFGLGFALYHHALQMLPAGTIPCPATGPSCAKITFIEYGYITYPLMAATLFVFLTVAMLSFRHARAGVSR